MRSVKKSWSTIEDVLEFWRSDYEDHDELKTLLMKKLSLLSKKITDVHALADNIKQMSSKSFAIGDVWYLVESNWFRAAARYLGIDTKELTAPKEVVITTVATRGSKKDGSTVVTGGNSSSGGGGGGGGNSSNSNTSPRDVASTVASSAAIVRRDSARSSDSHPRQSGGGLESRRDSCQSTDSEGHSGGLSGSQQSLVYDEAGMDCFFPGPIDNSPILKEGSPNDIKAGLAIKKPTKIVFILFFGVF
jgi:hypothetical protein